MPRSLVRMTPCFRTDLTLLLAALLLSATPRPFGVLGHVEDADVRDVLQKNLEDLGVTAHQAE